jgi:hypothetical protein
MKKRLKITVGINSLVATRYPAYTNHIQTFFRLGRNHPKIDLVLTNPERMTIDRMKNMAAEVALDTQSDYLLIIDDDVLLPVSAQAGKDWLDMLLATKADVVAGDVLIRGYPFDHMMFRWDKKHTGLFPMHNVPEPRGVIDVDAVGFSLCLIKTSLLRKIVKPYFITGQNNTEDIYFCLKVQSEVPKAKIKVDTRIICGHILWDEIISSNNKANFKQYYEKQFPADTKKINEAIWRGKGYINVIHGIVDAPAAPSAPSVPDAVQAKAPDALKVKRGQRHV